MKSKQQDVPKVSW